MKIIFYLKNGHNFETFWCSEKDVIRLASQFNNGHLMHVKKLYINPKELISFVWEYLKNGGELLFPCKEINRVIVLKHR